MKHEWKVGDWVILDLDIGQITRFCEDGAAEFSTGFINTSGHSLAGRFRHLTLNNKRIVETLDAIYKRLKEIDGNVGFNYPDISSYFASLALEAIDREDSQKKVFDTAYEFVREARNYRPTIQGVRLFRRAV